MKKSKGFTLVELLAVIVILAVLVLVAMPAVTSIMQRSQQNSFKNEMLNVVKEFNTAFTEKSGKKIEKKETLTTEDAAKTVVYNVTTKGGFKPGSYKYLCMTLKDLVDEQYVKKDLGESYGGYIQMWVPNTGEPIVYINVTNSAYYLQGKESQISNADHIPSQDPIKSNPWEGFETEPSKSTQCPTNFNIPDDTAVNAYKETK